MTLQINLHLWMVARGRMQLRWFHAKGSLRHTLGKKYPSTAQSSSFGHDTRTWSAVSQSSSTSGTWFGKSSVFSISNADEWWKRVLTLQLAPSAFEVTKDMQCSEIAGAFARNIGRLVFCAPSSTSQTMLCQRLWTRSSNRSSTKLSNPELMRF